MNSKSFSPCWVQDDELDYDYAPQVIFTTVDNKSSPVPSTKKLECNFFFKDDFIPLTEDYVAVISVGSKSLHDCIGYLNISETSTAPKNLVFNDEVLHKTKDDFYQFIYVRKNTVYGTSATFFLHFPYRVNDCDDCPGPESEKLCTLPIKLYQELLIKSWRLEEENHLLSKQLSVYKSSFSPEKDSSTECKESENDLASIHCKLNCSSEKDTSNDKVEPVKTVEEYKDMLNKKEESYDLCLKKFEEKLLDLVTNYVQAWQIAEDKYQNYEMQLAEKDNELANLLKEKDQAVAECNRCKSQIEELETRNNNYEMQLAEKDDELANLLEEKNQAVAERNRYKSQIKELENRNNVSMPKRYMTKCDLKLQNLRNEKYEAESRSEHRTKVQRQEELIEVLKAKLVKKDKEIDFLFNWTDTLRAAVFGKNIEE